MLIVREVIEYFLVLFIVVGRSCLAGRITSLKIENRVFLHQPDCFRTPPVICTYMKYVCLDLPYICTKFQMKPLMQKTRFFDFLGGRLYAYMQKQKIIRATCPIVSNHLFFDPMSAAVQTLSTILNFMIDWIAVLLSPTARLVYIERR